MRTNLLLPSYFKYIGYMLAVPGLVLGYFFAFESFTFKFLSNGHRRSMLVGSENYTDEVTITLIVIGLFFICFSANRAENERSQASRHKALYLSVFIAVLVPVALFIFSLLSVVPRFLAFLPLYFFLYQPVIFIALSNSFLYFKSQEGLNNSPPLPHKYFHNGGLYLLITCILLRAIYACVNYTNNDLLTGIYYAGTIGLLLSVFSKEKLENITMINYRSGSMQIAVYIAAGMFLIATWYIYGLDYLGYMYLYPVYLLVIYTVIFQYKLYKNRKQIQKIIALTN
ncbi:hypothetical protein ACFGVR_06010 [Mucilaginibacter sp. AW1-3]